MTYPRDIFVRHVAHLDELMPYESIEWEPKPCHHHRWTGIARTTEEEWRRGVERERRQ